MTLIMKFILINDIDNNLIDLLDLLLRLLTKSKDVIEYRKTLISIDSIKIVPILLSKLELVCNDSFKILHFSSSTSDPKDFIISMIIHIFKYLYSYDTLKIEENKDNFSQFSKNTINTIKIISFNISIERNLALNLSIITHLLSPQFADLTYQSIFDFCVVSVDSKNNLDEVLFEILFQRLSCLREDLTIRFFEDMTANCRKNQNFVSRICDLSYFILVFNLFLKRIFETSNHFFIILIQQS